jgi:threonyl-tRNA synthetase
VDIDDREESLSKKIREAEMEWIQYIVIIGEKEISSNTISVRDRMKKSSYESTIMELKELIQSQTKDKPYLPLNLPELLSNRPKIMN